MFGMNDCFSRGLFAVAVLFACRGIFASCEYPDIIYVPVTFYDYHSDRSNPEFEQRHYGQVRKNMVAQSLDADSKPQLGSSPYMNYDIKKWFRPWSSGDYTIPYYTPKAGFEEFFAGDNWVKEYQQVETFNGFITLNTDTSFKNIVIHDSLPFHHKGNGVYEYSNDAFFPLDNRGFGNEWNHEVQKTNQTLKVHHNYSFTMELHETFVKKSGMTFNFKGDDDVWAFVDNKLQMDIGGIHEAAEGDFSLDKISGLTNGKAYSLSVFYAERHSAESHILITTNIIQPRNNLRIYTSAGTPDSAGNNPVTGIDTITAGDLTSLYARVFDSSGVKWLSSYDALVTWTVMDTMGEVVLSTGAGALTSFLSTKANRTITLVARFTDPSCSEFISIVTLVVYIKPAAEHHVNIMEDSTVKYLYEDDPFKELVLPFVNSSAYIYAVVRDSFGNYIRRTDATWTSFDGSVATVNPLTGSSFWKAYVKRAAGGSTGIKAAEGSLVPDTIEVVAAGSENIAASPNPFIPGVTDLNSVLSASTLRFYDNVVTAGAKGVLIALSVKRPLTGNIKVVIYDIVGNIVRDNLVAKPARDGSSMKYGLVWDGVNRRGRYAGPGAYLAVAEGVYRDMSPFYRRIKIGVTR
ncbi:MAG TPA: hypothetical protein DCO75_06170 [Fibrobacteres bacterium]|nr:hypothetical protein [Fibrobacterota bacterium]